MDTQLKGTIVVDDIVPKDFQDYIEQTLLSTPNWRFVDDMSYADFKMEHPSYGFNMMFKHPGHGVVSNLYETISVPLSKYFPVPFEEIYFNRCFLQLPLDNKFIKENNGIHIDIPQDHYACVYYVNDSDGETIVYEQTMHNTVAGSKNVELKEHKRVMPKKGRMVFFDGMRYHCSTQPRNGYRCIINFDLI